MGGNVFNSLSIKDGVDNTLVAEVNSSKELKVKDADLATSQDDNTNSIKDLLQQILVQLKVNNMQLSIITGDVILEKEAEKGINNES